MADLVQLFVYGTLKRGLSRHGVLKDQQFICAARTAHRFRLFDCGGYPGMVAVVNGERIYGEVFAITPECLRHCDLVEAVADGLYSRQMIGVQSVDNHAIHNLVWVYLYQHSTDGLRDCGTIWTQ